MVVRDHDVSRFADRSRELWSEQTMSEGDYEEKNCLGCCENCPFSSFFAFMLTLIGTAVCCACLFDPLQETIRRVNDVFGTEYIDPDW
ncbi:unnamed protein product [Rotaria magnacalcarata]|nr:unnamed protein product [Rotaria magnacalcarata]